MDPATATILAGFGQAGAGLFGSLIEAKQREEDRYESMRLAREKAKSDAIMSQIAGAQQQSRGEQDAMTRLANIFRQAYL